ncbi:MOSC domain-containing protein [bacterium]|nr:MOSC domain-containing protein [bacterium]
MRLSQIWTYPVKSMVGEMVSSCEVNELGVIGDRIWATRDLERGGIRGAKKIGGLMQFSAERVDPVRRIVKITAPNGESFLTNEAGSNEKLSTLLGHRVVLEELPDASNVEHFRRGPSDSDDVMAEMRAVFGRTDDEPLPDFSIFPPEVMEFESPPGTHHDCYPLMVMTTSALAAMKAAVPNAVVDVKRFRPSLVVDSGDADGHPEFSWKNKRIAIGSAVIEILDACPRCVMVTRAINKDIPEDRAVLRHIVRDLNQSVGVYARVLTPGTCSVGDEIRFL